MSAAADFPNAWATAEKGRHVDSGEIRSALTELDALRAELSALKARRCDGCAHGEAAEDRGDGAMVVKCSFLARWMGAEFACAAWTEKPHMMTGIWPSRAGEGTHDLADDAWTEKP